MNCDAIKSLLKEMSQEGYNPHRFMVCLLLDEVLNWISVQEISLVSLT